MWHHGQTRGGHVCLRADWRRSPSGQIRRRRENRILVDVPDRPEPVSRRTEMSFVSKHSKLHRLVVGGFVAVAAAAPLALATAPAQAATSSGCTVNPLKPVFAGFNASGVKLVKFSVSVRCSGDRSVTV